MPKRNDLFQKCVVSVNGRTAGQQYCWEGRACGIEENYRVVRYEGVTNVVVIVKILPGHQLIDFRRGWQSADLTAVVEARLVTAIGLPLVLFGHHVVSLMRGVHIGHLMVRLL
jgi:hypothetical protein